MACCLRVKRHAKSSSSDSCPMMDKNPMMDKKFNSHESMVMDASVTMNAEDPNRNTILKRQAVNFFKEFFSKDSFKDLTSGRQNTKDFREYRNLLFLDVKPAERCDQIAFRAGSFSNAGKRGQQSFDNYLLFSVADKPRPPTVVPINFATRVICTLKELIQSRRSFSRGPPAFFS